MSSYSAAHFSEIEVIDDGRCPLRPVRHHFGITTFGVNTWTAKEPGDRLINEHDETDVNKEELYLVLEGRARFELDGEEVDAPSGTFVYAAPSVRRTAFAEEPATTLLAMGGAAPGQPYTVEGWEIWGPMMRLFQAGEYGEAADWVTERLGSGDLPESATLYYNLACAESLAGRHSGSIEHLRRAIAMDGQFRAMAGQDSDFDSVRELPEFEALMRDEG